MNRVITIFLIIIALIFGSVVYSEAAPIIDNTFDNTLFDGLQGYEYHKMDKTYRYEVDYTKTWSDAWFTLGLVAEGEKNKAGSLWMHLTEYEHSKTTSTYNKITGISILIDDELYEYKKLYISDGGYSTVTFGNIGIDMIHALCDVEDFAIRYYYDGYHVDIEPSINDIQMLVIWANKIVETGYIDKMDTTDFAFLDYYYGASKE